MIDHTCLIHGKKISEHDCLYCCLCFKSLTADECHVRSDGVKEDVCKSCAEREIQSIIKEEHLLHLYNLHKLGISLEEILNNACDDLQARFLINHEVCQQFVEYWINLLEISSEYTDAMVDGSY